MFLFFYRAVFKFDENNRLGVTATGSDFTGFKSYFGTDERGFGYIRIKVKSIAHSYKWEILSFFWLKPKSLFYTNFEHKIFDNFSRPFVCLRNRPSNTLLCSQLKNITFIDSIFQNMH